MKKTICLLITICLLFSITGCRNVQNQGGQGDKPTNPTGSPTDPSEFTPAQEAMAAVSVPATTMYGTAQDGTTVLSYTYQGMSLILPDPDVADKVIRDFLDRVASTHDTAYALYGAAVAAYNGSSGWNPYLYSVTYSPTRIDLGVLSLYGSTVTYSGAFHPERHSRSANYDLLTGDVLTLASIMSASATKDDFVRLVLESLEEIEDSAYLRDGYEETVRQRFSRDESTDQDWYFTNTGLCFYFDPYEIAPYSSGVIVAEIPYSKLAGLIYDGYFPAERDIVESNVNASLFSNVDPNRFSQTAELILNMEDQMFFLYTDGLVWDVQIDVGTWDPSGTEFTSEYTALYSHALSPGDALMIQASFGDAQPALRLTYQSGTQTITKYISQSGKDGKIILTEA